MTPEQLVALKEDIARTIKETVNGKIDANLKKIDDIQEQICTHNKAHEQDMARIMPIVEAYETAERRVEDAKQGGRTIIWISGFITAVGGAYLIIKQILLNQ